MRVLFIVDTEFDAPIIKTKLTELEKFNLRCIEVLDDDCFRGSVCHSYMSKDLSRPLNTRDTSFNKFQRKAELRVEGL